MPRLALALGLLLAAPAAAFWWGRPHPLPKADFTFLLPKENTTVDPGAVSTVSDNWIVQALFEGLTRLDPESLAPIAGVAERYQVAADGRTWTFHLRAGAAWSDGEPVTSADFLYAWRRLLDPRSGLRNGALLDRVAGAAEAAAGTLPLDAVGMSAPDPRTFEVRLREACPYFAAVAAHPALMPLRRDRVEGDPRWFEPGRLVGNGPFLLELRRLRDRVRLARNPRYRDAANVGLAVVDALAVDSSAAGLNLYLTGGADWVNAIPAAAVARLRGRADLHVGPQLATNFLRMNVTAAPLADVLVRRAIDRAIDRTALCRYVYRRGEVPATSLVPPSLAGYQPARAAPANAEIARDLLARAGFPGGRGFPELELLFPADETVRAVAEALAARLEEVLGIRVRPQPQEFKVYIDSQKQLRYQLCLANWIGDWPDPLNFLELFRGDSPNNRTGWRDGEFEAMLARAATLPSEPARLRALAEVEELLLDRGPIAPICYRAQPNLVALHVEGFTDNLLDLHPLERLRVRRP